MDESSYKHREHKKKNKIEFENQIYDFDNVYFGHGGFVCEDENLLRINRMLRYLKNKHFGNTNIPIKNNYKDFKKIYEEKYNINIETINQNINKFRIDLFKKLEEENIKAIISFVNLLSQNYQSYEVFSFINVIQRFAKEDGEIMQVVYDWKDKDNKEKYEKNYRSMFLYGNDLYGNTCGGGPLIKNNFYPNICFSSTKKDGFLQIADFIVGSWRYLIKEYIKEEKNLEDITPLDELELLCNVCRTHQSKVFGSGLIFNTKNNEDPLKDFKKEIISYNII